MSVNHGRAQSVRTRPTRAAVFAIGIGSLLLLALLATRAVDVLVLLAVCGVIFLLERSVGDWLVDALGPFLSKVAFVGGVLLIGAGLLAVDSIRHSLYNGLHLADELGLHSLLVDHVSTDGGLVIEGGGGGGAGFTAPTTAAQSPVQQSSGSVDSVTSGTSRSGLLRTRMVLRVGGQGNTVMLQADIISDSGVIDEGRVEFSVDGERVSVGRVINGRAEARVVVSSGSHRGRAHFTGTSQLAASTAEAAFSR